MSTRTSFALALAMSVPTLALATSPCLPEYQIGVAQLEAGGGAVVVSIEDEQSVLHWRGQAASLPARFGEAYNQLPELFPVWTHRESAIALTFTRDAHLLEIGDGRTTQVALDAEESWDLGAAADFWNGHWYFALQETESLRVLRREDDGTWAERMRMAPRNDWGVGPMQLLVEDEQQLVISRSSRVLEIANGTASFALVDVRSNTRSELVRTASGKACFFAFLQDDRGGRIERFDHEARWRRSLVQTTSEAPVELRAASDALFVTRAWLEGDPSSVTRIFRAKDQQWKSESPSALASPREVIAVAEGPLRLVTRVPITPPFERRHLSSRKLQRAARHL